MSVGLNKVELARKAYADAERVYNLLCATPYSTDLRRFHDRNISKITQLFNDFQNGLAFSSSLPLEKEGMKRILAGPYKLVIQGTPNSRDSIFEVGSIDIIDNRDIEPLSDERFAEELEIARFLTLAGVYRQFVKNHYENEVYLAQSYRFMLQVKEVREPSIAQFIPSA